jgi:hypothetical protein
MNNTIWNKRIPTLLGISIITAGIAITSFLVKSGVIFISQARPVEAPQKLKITNISDASFTVSYSTEDNVIGSVNFGKDENLGQAAFDDRDQKAPSLDPHKIHSITVKNLTPETRYFFSIISGQKKILNSDLPFEVSTASTLKAPPRSRALSLKGKVILPNAEKVTEAVVYATTENGQVISATLKDGSYTLPLSSMRTSDLSSYFNFEENTIVKIAIENDGLKSNVSISAYQETVPTVTLSYDYDFTITAKPPALRSTEPIGFPPVPFVQEQVLGISTIIPQIVLPKKDQEFTDQQPEFRGITIPNGTIRITIQSPQNLVTQTIADIYGNWKYRPPNPLSPGRHTITITAADASGIIKTITRSFVIHAQGTQVNQSATPSATPTLAFPSIPIPTRTPTPVRSPTPTPTKTLALAFTPTPTSILTITPTPTLCPGCPSPTPTSSLPLSPTPLIPTPTPTLCPGCPTPTPTITTSEITPVPTIVPPGDSSMVTIGVLGVSVAVIGVLLFLLARTGI